MDDYKDIINLPHHISKKRPQMSLYARSAQFAPFAALTGYSDEVKEKARLTNKRIELSEEEKEFLNGKILKINEVIKTRPKISVTYFVKDLKKEGGSYLTVTDNVKRVDDVLGVIKFKSKDIKMDNIINIEMND
jgi:CRISPR/Cas system-associated endonuclease Cas3-HD